MNIKNFFTFILFIGLTIGLTACSETDDKTVEYADWQNTNIKYFNDIYAKAITDIAEKKAENAVSEWDTIRCWSLNDTVARLAPTDYIVIHREKSGSCKYCDLCKLEKEDETVKKTIHRQHLNCHSKDDPNEMPDRPMYTDSVMVHNQGKLLPSLSYPLGNVIEKSYDGGDFSKYDENTATKKKWAVSGLIDGYTTALMHMHIGDRWTVYMPWTLAYGTADYNSIPGYSVLVWDITLLGYYRPGESMPDTEAKHHKTNVWITE